MTGIDEENINPSMFGTSEGVPRTIGEGEPAASSFRLVMNVAVQTLITQYNLGCFTAIIRYALGRQCGALFEHRCCTRPAKVSSSVAMATSISINTPRSSSIRSIFHRYRDVITALRGIDAIQAGDHVLARCHKKGCRHEC